jgi:hypothetical protein
LPPTTTATLRLESLRAEQRRVREAAQRLEAEADAIRTEEESVLTRRRRLEQE